MSEVSQEKKWYATGAKPMRKGWSGAEIVFEDVAVWKSGKNVDEQGDYCRKLGPIACPVVSRVAVDGYCMERLQEPEPAHHLAMFEAAKNKLRWHVWNRPIESFNINPKWRGELYNFAYEYGYNVGRFLDKLYPGPFQTYSLIHGDPTLSNMMMRPPGDLILIDPIFPKGKIPPLREVDLGKMFQSAIGWETLTMGWKIDQDRSIEVIMDKEDAITAVKSCFWAAVHLMRILPYSQYADVDEWCREKIEGALSGVTRELRIRS